VMRWKEILFNPTQPDENGSAMKGLIFNLNK
jgi:hypothetical protein